MRKVVPRGLEPRTLRLLAVRSNQLSYETSCIHGQLVFSTPYFFVAEIAVDIGVGVKQPRDLWPSFLPFARVP
jgi:hypothetical protein